MSVPPETCGTCRFNGAQYDLQDTRGTLRALGVMWEQTIEGQAEVVLEARPGPQGLSASEHAWHSAEVTERVIDLFDRAVGGSRPPSPEPGRSLPDPVDRVKAALSALHDRALRVPARDKAWATTVQADGLEVDVAWLVRHAIHEVSHHLSEVGRALHRVGAGAPTQEGAVAQLNMSGGGVPKTPVEEAEVGARGLAGDRQAARKHHGRPLQALCLWSAEVIDALRAEGHPIEAGSAGENVTITGIDWVTVRPGTQMRLGDVLAELSAWTTPCKKNAQWFRDGDFNRMLHARHPGWSRAYAWVHGPGRIRTGDPVIVEP